jgi:hypothetical protein
VPVPTDTLTLLDSAPPGSPLDIWTVGYYSPPAEEWCTVGVTAASAWLGAGGSLIFLDEADELARAYGPTGWDSIRREGA